VPSLYLVPYSIRVKDIQQNQDVKPGCIQDWDNDLLEVLSTYIEHEMPFLSFNPEEKDKKTLRKDTFEKEDRIFSSTIKAGEYGIVSDLHDVQTDQSKYSRQPIDAELIPYYLMVKVPVTTSSAIAIFQRVGNSGFKDIFEKDFGSYIHQKFHGRYRITIDPLVPTDLVKKYLENRITKIRFIKYSFPGEISDVDLSGTPDEEQGEAEYVIKAHRNKPFPLPLLDKFNRGVDDFLGETTSSVGSILELREFNADNVKVEVRIGTSYRTIDLSNLDRLKFAEDITNKVGVEDNGMYKIEDLKKSALEFLGDCSEAVWGEGHE